MTRYTREGATESVNSPGGLIFFMGVGETETTTVLVVDDEEHILDYLARHLRKNGYEVVTATSGEEALLVVERQNLKPQVLITDLVLRGMSGFALANTLRGANPNLKTLFASGYTGAEMRRMTKVSTTESAFLQKPVTVEALLETVRQLLTKRSAQRHRASEI